MGVGRVAAVLGPISLYGDLVSLFHGGPSPTAANETVWATEFEAPVSNLAVFVLHVDVKPRMRIGPLHFSDRPGDFDGFVCVELSRKSMMRRSRHDQEQ